MHLIYRAHTYTCAPAAATIEQLPCAVNWRYQVPGQSYAIHQVRCPSAINPRAVNWRYQVPGLV